MPALFLGIDPAPKKQAVAFRYEAGQGVYSMTMPPDLSFRGLGKLLEKAAASRSEVVLVAWDAPLTGPTDPSSNSRSIWESDFSMRPIEKTLRAMTPPDWVSILPYSGCPHWAITHSLLGLPKLGKYDERKDLPFELLAQDKVPSEGRWVAEVHPAVAMWFWTGWDDPAAASPEDLGKYKAGRNCKTSAARENRTKLWAALNQKWKALGLHLLAELAEDAGGESKILESDDNLDAFIAVALAILFFKETKVKNGKRAVRLFGNEKTGAMLLPSHPELGPQLNPNEMMGKIASQSEVGEPCAA